MSIIDAYELEDLVDRIAAYKKRITELEAALLRTHDIVNDAQQNGFEPGMGDWLRPLQENQETIRSILGNST